MVEKTADCEVKAQSYRQLCDINLLREQYNIKKVTHEKLHYGMQVPHTKGS